MLVASLKVEGKHSSDVKNDAIAPCGFFKLPGEIKNQIYELVFDPCDIEIKWLKRRRTLTHLVYKSNRLKLDQTQAWGTTKTKGKKALTPPFSGPTLGAKTVEIRRLLHHPRSTRLDLEETYSNAHTRAALLFTCRAIHNEAASMFYGAQSFGFSSRGLLEKFLSTINPIAKASITRLFLQHETYGEPYLIADIPWKTTHDAKWATCCATLATDLKSLKELHLLLKINDKPLHLNLAAGWVAPLLSFQDIGLKVFGLELLVRRLNSKTNTNLRSCGRVVREAVLGVEYDEVAEERKRKILEDPAKYLPKATRCLRITG